MKRKLYSTSRVQKSMPGTGAERHLRRTRQAAALALLLPALLGNLGTVHGSAAILRVNAAQTNNVPDGTSWPTAYPKVQSAVNTAASGDAVWVAAATYPENITLKSGVGLYGGFAGTESGFAQRNWATNLTILDGRKSNSVVIVAMGASNTTCLDGFIIQNGKALNGGGVLCSNASPVIQNNIILQNQATNGAGLYCAKSAALIAANVIRENVAVLGSGGIHCVASAVHIRNNSILENTGNAAAAFSLVSSGGVLCSDAPAPEIVGNFIVGNWNPGHGSPPIFAAGAGIAISGDCPAAIVNNTIIWNQGPTTGAGIAYSTGFLTGLTNFPVIANNIIAFGSSGVLGVPGMAFSNNCVFGNGSSDFRGLSNSTGTNGNISVDPLLIADPLHPNVHVSLLSPCRDAGENGVVQPDWFDIDGGARVVGPAVDIGADEYDGLPPAPQAPTIVRVSLAGNDRNDGSDWTKSKRTVQAAVDLATLFGGEVWVKAGTYSEHLTLRPFVNLYGGFAGSETNRTQRDWNANITRLDGSHNGSVISATGLMQWNAIDGFVIQNGSAPQGAGIWCSRSSPFITHNTIQSNTAASLGGGLACDAPVIISNNVVRFNRAQSGGGIAATAAGTVIVNNRIEGNVAAATPSTTGAGGGGGAYVGAALVMNNFFLNNVATNGYTCTSGGGITVNSWQGGAIMIYSSSFGSIVSQIINNSMVGNRATSSCSGVQTEDGGGIAGGGASEVIMNNLIAYGSSGIVIPPLAFRNNCVFGNTRNYLVASDPTGTKGNISVAPLLVAANDFHLGATSPCINSGNNLYATNTVDLDGDPRIDGGTVDIGADEIQSAASILSYAWLQQYGLPIDGSADNADPDYDGASNWLEWQAGTNPTNALSLPIPVITVQPSGQSQVPGLAVSFSAAASSTVPFGYQWQLNGTDIPDATTSAYSISNVQPANFGVYRMVVTNMFGSAVSSNAILELGRIAVWGDASPVPAGLGATNVLAIAGGGSHALLFRADGAVKGWGRNAYGETRAPADLTNALAIAAADESSLAVTANGFVREWGRQDQTAVIPNLSNVVSACAAFTFSLALKSDGTVTAWGYACCGQKDNPAGLSNVVAISSAFYHSLALKADGTIVAWGEDFWGQATVPAGLSNVVAIAAGQVHSVALKADGTVVDWGSPGSNRIVPADLTNVVAIAAGDDHSLALKADGTVVAWGSNQSGQTDVPPGLTHVIAISSEASGSLALLGDGPPVLQATLNNAQLKNNAFSLQLPTQSGRVYKLEYRNSLSDTNWTALPLVAGNGRPCILTDPAATNAQRFYRVRRW